jgi:hypothetical protein
MDPEYYKFLMWLFNNGPTLLISVISIIISIRAWYKSRVFYGIEVFKLSSEDPLGIANQKLKEKLNTGKYTILNNYKDQSSMYGGLHTEEKVFIILGQIKK